jgi:hypothetical protein
MVGSGQVLASGLFVPFRPPAVGLHNGRTPRDLLSRSCNCLGRPWLTEFVRLKKLARACACVEFCFSLFSFLVVPAIFNLVDRRVFIHDTHSSVLSTANREPPSAQSAYAACRQDVVSEESWGRCLAGDMTSLALRRQAPEIT